MATPALIGLLEPNEIVSLIYLHWDGHLSHAGKILEQYYNSYDMAEKLIHMGGLSSIEKNLYPNPSKPHTFTNPQDDVTVAYTRDRGDKIEIDHEVHLSDKAMIHFMSQHDVEYLYLFKDNHWHWAKPGYTQWKRIPSKYQTPEKK